MTTLPMFSVAEAAGGGDVPKPEAANPNIPVLDPVKTELVMNIIALCSEPERLGPSDSAPDGKRDEIWPITGGVFYGPGIRGTVVPGGGDFPVLRPDGVEVVDALYRLKTDDGVTIIIHNRGIAYSEFKYRLAPQFTVTAGKYDWLNKSMFIATLVYPVPPAYRIPMKKGENDRLIQVHKVL